MKILGKMLNYTPINIADTMLKSAEKDMEDALSIANDLSEDEKNMKSFLSGIKSGFVNAATFFYIPMTVLCFLWRSEALKSRELLNK